MILEQAKIFLAEERGVSETNCFKRHSTFNFDNYFNQYKTSFGFVEAINDDILDANCTIKLSAAKDYYLLLIPVMGAIKFTTSTGHGSFVAAGQSQLLPVGKGDELMVRNPFSDGLINFLHIWIGRDQNSIVSDCLLLGFDVNEHKNNLQELLIEWPIGRPAPFSLSIGKFDGRNETKYRLKKRY